MKKIVLGVLAHVDAGKTTLSEGMLYLSGAIRKAGRVDHKDAFLDNFDLERQRGITIFSKQAIMEYEDTMITLLDTPGHVDFSAEMERTLQVLDYAVLVISASEGVQGHTETLWRLLKMYKIPTMLFVNKMDIANEDKEHMLEVIKKKLSDAVADFTDPGEMYESVAMCDEKALNEFLETGSVDEKKIKNYILERKVFPCYFGSALKMQGIDELLGGINMYLQPKKIDVEFGAKIYKISRDAKGTRLTYLKVTGGELKVKTLLEYENSGERFSEKVNQIRIYSGEKYQAVDIATAGTVCAVTGLSATKAGQGLGFEKKNTMNYLMPVLNYFIILPENVNSGVFYKKLKELEEEIPELHLVWDDTFKEIHVQLMGEIQLEILKSMIKSRFDTEVSFGTGNIVYKETIENTVEGVGHFEPLRHYAEVHLLMEPLERGSGLVFETDCSEDILNRNWQRLIMTHLNEKAHKGVLTGSEITDMKITVISGKAHLKHTEGGDFRQATYRAVRQGLKSAVSILLEPYYEFEMTLPSDSVGRAMQDLQNMHADFTQPLISREYAVIEGKVPAACMQGYISELIHYTKGKGNVNLRFAGYDKCHNQDEIIADIGYDSELDTQNPTGSVFCAHGAGYTVPWDKVKSHMHMPARQLNKQDNFEVMADKKVRAVSSEVVDEDELKQIFERTYGEIKTPVYTGDRLGKSVKKEKEYQYRPNEKKDQYLLVDGYNLIFATEELNELSKISLEAARDKLMDILSNYQGYKKCTLILVFDAYKVKGNPGEVQKYNNIYVVYTKEAETADMYIEKTVHEINKKYDVTVVTSDGLEQIIIMGQGAQRVSSREFMLEIEKLNNEMREIYSL